VNRVEASADDPRLLCSAHPAGQITFRVQSPLPESVLPDKLRSN
jgi:hypothetical protein